jgi:uncharacterized membrane protein
MFINYFRDETRQTPVNLAAARIILAGYLIWKTVWYDWGRLIATPFVASDSYTFLVPSSPSILVAEKWVLIALLVGVILGYRLGVTTFLSALIVAHLGAVRYTLNTSGGTTALFFSVYFLILFGLYREQDVLTLDNIRREHRTENSASNSGATRSSSLIREFKAHVDSPVQDSYPMTALKWSLVVIAIVYFGSGFDKLLSGGLAWAATDNLSRILLVWDTLYTHPFSFGLLLLEYPVLISAAAVGTLVFELGLLIAVLARITIVPFVGGVLGMQIAIALAIGPFFFDVFVFLAMFAAWDRLYLGIRNWREG